MKTKVRIALLGRKWAVGLCCGLRLRHSRREPGLCGFERHEFFPAFLPGCVAIDRASTWSACALAPLCVMPLVARFEARGKVQSRAPVNRAHSMRFAFACAMEFISAPVKCIDFS